MQYHAWIMYAYFTGVLQSPFTEIPPLFEEWLRVLITAHYRSQNEVVQLLYSLLPLFLQVREGRWLTSKRKEILLNFKFT